MKQNDSTTAMNYYEILGVTSQSNLDDIKDAYRAKSHVLHPDKIEQNHKDAKSIDYDMADLNLAYETLSDPIRKVEYDRSLRDAEKQAQRQAYLAKEKEKKRIQSKKDQYRMWTLRFIILLLSTFMLFVIYRNHKKPHTLQLADQVDQLKPLVDPQVQAITQGKTLPLQDLINSPQGTMVQQVLQSYVTPELCLQKFPNDLQRKDRNTQPSR